MRSKQITIRDVAREASVSTAAVSQAFNSSGRLSDETRKRILTVAHRLKYRPNRQARDLAMGNTKTFGIVVSDIENPVFAVIIKNFEAHARRLGYEVIASETGYDVALMQRAAERMIGQKVSGVAIMTSEMNAAWLEEIVGRGIAVTGLDLDFVSEYASNIKINYASAIQLLLEHLYHLGHRRIGYVGGRRRLRNVHSRHESYLRSMTALGLEPGPIVMGNQRLDGGYAAGMSISKMSPRCTAVVAVNDLTAVGLVNAFSESGIRVPQDISVTGFDNTYLAAYFVPRLTTVDIHADTLGRVAADALYDAVTSRTTGHSEYAVKCDLVVGKSTGPAPDPTI